MSKTLEERKTAFEGLIHVAAAMISRELTSLEEAIANPVPGQDTTQWS